MDGPYPPGQWTGARPQEAFKHLVPGEKFEVVQAFVDYDQATHPPGERWTFVGYGFLPYDDGLSLFVSLDGVSEWRMRLQWRDDQQGPIIDALDRHIRSTRLPR